jgi:glucokinase
MTNLSWRIDAARLKQKLRAPVLVLNDLEAAGYAVRKPGATAVLKPGTVEKNGTRAVIAAGTGLGMALVTDGKVVPSEGGHATFAPVTAWESAMAQHLHGVLGRWPDTEDLVSGPGINRIYRSLAPAAEEIRSEDITKNALRSPRCKDAVEKFCGLYARAIRDLALYAKATGGVYVTGGIGRAVQGFLARAVPRAFSQKGGIEPLLKRIPVFLLQGQAVILEGAAQAGNAQAAGKDA